MRRGTTDSTFNDSSEYPAFAQDSETDSTTRCQIQTISQNEAIGTTCNDCTPSAVTRQILSHSIPNPHTDTPAQNVRSRSSFGLLRGGSIHFVVLNLEWEPFNLLIHSLFSKKNAYELKFALI